MADLKPEVEGVALVLVGSFNPTIYHPVWFGRNELIKAEEVETAKVDVMHNEITSVLIGSIKFQVQPDKFQASTTNPADYEVLRDVVVGTFKILPHTPIRMLGINLDLHYRLASVEAWHNLGHRLAPKDLWGHFMEKPGLLSLTIEGDAVPNEKGLRAKVEPSTRIKNGVGVYVSINDHHEIKGHKSEDGCVAIIDHLISNWATSLERSRSIAEAIATYE